MTNLNMTCEGGNLAAPGFKPRLCSGKNLFLAMAFGKGGCLPNTDVIQSHVNSGRNELNLQFEIVMAPCCQVVWDCCSDMAGYRPPPDMHGPKPPSLLFCCLLGC